MARKRWRRAEDEAGERGGLGKAMGAPGESEGVGFEFRIHAAGCSDG